MVQSLIDKIVKNTRKTCPSSAEWRKRILWHGHCYNTAYIEKLISVCKTVKETSNVYVSSISLWHGIRGLLWEPWRLSCMMYRQWCQNTCSDTEITPDTSPRGRPCIFALLPTVKLSGFVSDPPQGLVGSESCVIDYLISIIVPQNNGFQRIIVAFH